MSEKRSEKAVILYDGVCNLCNASVRFVLARDNADHFRFAPLQSEAGKTLAAKHNLTTDLSTFFLIDGDKAYERSDAWLEIMRRLELPWSASYLLKVVPQPVRDTREAVRRLGQERLSAELTKSVSHGQIATSVRTLARTDRAQGKLNRGGPGPCIQRQARIGASTRRWAI